MAGAFKVRGTDNTSRLRGGNTLRGVGGAPQSMTVANPVILTLELGTPAFSRGSSGNEHIPLLRSPHPVERMK